MQLFVYHYSYILIPPTGSTPVFSYPNATLLAVPCEKIDNSVILSLSLFDLFNSLITSDVVLTKFMATPFFFAQLEKVDNSECAINLYGWNYLALISANTQTPRIRRIYSVDGEWNPFKEWVTTISLLLVISSLANVYNILEKSKEIGNYFWGFFCFIAPYCISWLFEKASFS